MEEIVGVVGSAKGQVFCVVGIEGYVAVRDMLRKIGIIQAKGNVCPIYNERKEESKHIFVHCERVYRAWASMAKLWNWNFVGLGDIVTTFNIWFHTSCSSQKISIWQMACNIALLWYVWRMSNQVIFQQYSFDEERCFKLCYFDLA